MVKEKSLKPRKKGWIAWNKGLTKETSESVRKIAEKRTGAIASKKTREKMSRSQKGRIPWNKGKKDCYSKKTIKKMSESRKGEKNPFFGKTHTKKTRKIMKKNHPDVKGEKNPFFKGEKISRENDYVFVYSPNHPRILNKNNGCRVKEHILVMEKKLGRYLEADEVIHHIDYNKKNNNCSNLFLTNHKGHGRAHYSIYSLVEELLKRQIIYFDKKQGEYFLGERESK